MRDKILSFPKQFEYEPHIENAENLKTTEYFIVVGMGGSHLAADLIRAYTSANVIVHKNYGLPKVGEEILRKSLIIFNSYSGNTEEDIDSFNEAVSAGLYNLAAVSTGGQLLDAAAERNIPFIKMPETDIQPRMALGFNIKALLKIMGREEDTRSLSGLNSLNAGFFEQKGKELATKLNKRVPIIYSSDKNSPLAYIWKIKFNENAKIPAFYNVFPELNHNEMTGFDVVSGTSELSKNMAFILLEDDNDDERLQARSKILKDLYAERGLEMVSITLEGENIWERVFSSVILADWVSYYLAEEYGVEPEKVPMVEEFKKEISKN